MKTLLFILLSICISNLTIACCDTLSLPTINILGTGWHSYLQDRQVIRIDTLVQLNNTSNLKEVLPLLGLGYVKDYGPGNSATYSYQGTGPQHNQIIWNGIPINSSLLGLNDLSLANVHSFQEINLINGTSSTYWGSGAIGSTILIDNLTQNENSISLNTSYNSLQNLTYNLTANYRNKNFSSLVSGTLLNNLNQYSVLDYTAPKKELRLISNQQKSDEFQWTSVLKLNQNNQFKLHVWNINSDRNISPSLTEVDHNARQKDNVLRAVGEWIVSKTEYNFRMLTGYVNERIIFKDDAVQDTGLVNSFFVQLNADKKINSYAFSVSLQSRFDKASNSSFDTKHERTINSLALNISKSLSTKSEAFINGRSELINGIQFIQVVSLGLYTKILNTSLKTYLSTSYNIPTFNDLYWVPGGNESLNPEKGINAGIDFEYKKKIANLNNSFGLNLFYHSIKDWIQWIPGTPYWRPVNYKKVVSLGGNVYWDFKILLGASHLNFHNSFQLTNATNKEVSELSGSNSLNKQLSYVPEYTAQNSITYNYDAFQLSYFQQWVGKRFTVTDESAFLEPYFLANIQAGYSLKTEKLIAKPYLSINNIFDAVYETVAYRPREPRNITIGLSIQLKAKNQK